MDVLESDAKKLKTSEMLIQITAFSVRYLEGGITVLMNLKALEEIAKAYYKTFYCSIVNNGLFTGYLRELCK